MSEQGNSIGKFCLLQENIVAQK